MGHLLERPVALVYVEQVRGVEPAHVDVQPAAVVDVDEGRALVPDARRGADPRLLRHILELVAAEVAEQPAALRLADDVDVGPPVAVVVADGDPGADRGGLELLVEVPAHPRVGIVVLGPHAGLLGGQLREHRPSPREGMRGQGPGRDAPRGIGRPCGRAGGQGGARQAEPGRPPRRGPGTGALSNFGGGHRGVAIRETFARVVKVRFAAVPGAGRGRASRAGGRQDQRGRIRRDGVLRRHAGRPPDGDLPWRRPLGVPEEAGGRRLAVVARARVDLACLAPSRPRAPP